MTQGQRPSGRSAAFEEPTDSQRSLIGMMADWDEPDFIRDLVRYLASGDPDGRAIFRSRELVTRTLDALRRIHADAQRRVRGAPGPERAAAQRMVELAAAELKVVNPLAKLVRMEAADASPRRWAERALADLHLDEIRFMLECHAAGMSRDAALAALRAQIRETDDGRIGWRAQANSLLGKMLAPERDRLMELLAAGYGRDEALAEVEKDLARRFGGPDQQ